MGEPDHDPWWLNAIIWVGDQGPWTLWMQLKDGTWARVARFWRYKNARAFMVQSRRDFPSTRFEVHTWWWKP